VELGLSLEAAAKETAATEKTSPRTLRAAALFYMEKGEIPASSNEQRGRSVRGQREQPFTSQNSNRALKHCAAHGNLSFSFACDFLYGRSSPLIAQAGVNLMFLLR
jgi:hypothetical protein